MSGKMARRKGSQNEYQVRDYFRELGFESDRVPSSGAAEGFKGDVTIKGFNLELKCEVKARKSEYRSIYTLFDNYNFDGDTYMALAHGGEIVIVSKSFFDLGFGEFSKPMLARAASAKDKGVRKLFGLKKLMFYTSPKTRVTEQVSDFLAIRINHKPFLYLRFL